MYSNHLPAIAGQEHTPIGVSTLPMCSRDMLPFLILQHAPKGRLSRALSASGLFLPIKVLWDPNRGGWGADGGGGRGAWDSLFTHCYTLTHRWDPAWGCLQVALYVDISGLQECRGVYFFIHPVWHTVYTKSYTYLRCVRIAVSGLKCSLVSGVIWVVAVPVRPS